jgi:hypothetical protein
VWEVAAFLDEVLPTSTKTYASTVQNRDHACRQRLERHQDTLAAAHIRESAHQVVLGLDGNMSATDIPPDLARASHCVIGGRNVWRSRYVTSCRVLVRCLHEHRVDLNPCIPGARLRITQEGRARITRFSTLRVPTSCAVLPWQGRQVQLRVQTRRFR